MNRGIFNNFKVRRYWTSCEGDKDRAWLVYINSLAKFYYYKNCNGRVIAFRRVKK